MNQVLHGRKSQRFCRCSVHYGGSGEQQVESVQYEEWDGLWKERYLELVLIVG